MPASKWHLNTEYYKFPFFQEFPLSIFSSLPPSLPCTKPERTRGKRAPESQVSLARVADMALRIASSVAQHAVAASLWATREYSVLPSWVAGAGIKGATTTSPRRRKFGLLSGAALVWLATLVGVSSVAWLIYNHTANVLPKPVSEDAAGKDGFSEERALRHVKFLADLGPRPIGSSALRHGVQVIPSLWV